MLRDFKKEKEMSKEIIEKYKGQVLDEVIEIWKNYGLGSFLNGYLRVINPDDYKELVEETYFRGNTYIVETAEKRLVYLNEKRKNNKTVYNIINKCCNCFFYIILSKFYS